MCDIVYLPDESEIWYVGELEKAFGKSVEDVADKECCLCHVDLPEYLNAVGATWKNYWDYPGDVQILSPVAFQGRSTCQPKPP